jgi:hypothetical protein
MALLSTVVLISIPDIFWWSDKYNVSIKKHGTELERFYVLLEENVNSNPMKGPIPLYPNQKKRLLSLLHSINYKTDCTQGSSHAVTGGMSCIVNGEKIDYIEWADADYDGN